MHRFAPILFAPTAFAVLTGCSASPVPTHPDGSATRRETAFVHEACDLEASDAKRTDANSDGHPDIVRVFDGGREICRAVDINMDTLIDAFIYYDKAGQPRRRESGFGRGAQPSEVSIFEGGVLVRKETETNNDKKIDTWTRFQNGRAISAERDSTGDGYIDQWWTFNRPHDPDCAIVQTDGNGDGKPDADSALDLCAEKDKTAAAAPTSKAAEPPKSADESESAQPEESAPKAAKGDKSPQPPAKEPSGATN